MVNWSEKEKAIIELLKQEKQYSEIEQELHVSSRDISDTKKRYEDEQYEIQSQSVQSDSHLTEPHKHQESDPNTETMTQVEHPGRSVEQLNTQVEHPGRSVEQLNTQVEHPKRLRLRRDKVRELKRYDTS